MLSVPCISYSAGLDKFHSSPYTEAMTTTDLSKSPFTLVLEEAFGDNKELLLCASFEATYTGNCVGGRPSDNARSAVRWVKDALKASDPMKLASPTAQKVMADYLSGVVA
jgi:hypothetical protein